jgi:hypothetical protein
LLLYFFSFFFSTGSADPAARVYNSGARVCTPAHLGDAARRSGLPQAQGLADEAPGGCSLGYGQAGVASPTPRPDSQTSGVRRPRGVPPAYWVLPPNPILLGPDAGPNRIIIKIIIFITQIIIFFLLILWIIIKIIIFITQIIIFKNARILLTQIILFLRWIVRIIIKIIIFIT